MTLCVFAKSLVSHFQREKNPDNLCKRNLSAAPLFLPRAEKVLNYSEFGLEIL